MTLLIKEALINCIIHQKQTNKQTKKKKKQTTQN